MPCMHALIVMPLPLSISQETIIIVLYYSVQYEVSAVRKPESPLVWSLFGTIIIKIYGNQSVHGAVSAITCESAIRSVR